MVVGPSQRHWLGVAMAGVYRTCHVVGGESVPAERCAVMGFRMPPPPPCTRATHDEITATAHSFAAGTKYVGPWPDGGGVMGTCNVCGSSLMFESGPDEDTLPMVPAMRAQETTFTAPAHPPGCDCAVCG